jgi:phage gp36-like protein
VTYCTKQDLIDRFGERELIQLTDRTNTPVSTVDDVVVNRALGDATSLIDGYVGKVYTLPLATVPDILAKLSADVARFYLHGKGVDKDHPVRVAYNDAVAYLVNVAKGLVQLVDIGSGETPPAAGGGQVQVIAPAKTFSRDSLKGF